jgi:hypothetical protein
MTRVRLLWFPFLLLCFSLYSSAQKWSGIITPPRAVDWSGAGVQGGIPSGSWTQCGSTIGAYSGSATTINNAISACGSNQYVQLGAGTFTLSSGITWTKSNVVLRGQGADQTKLVINNNTSGCSLFFNAAIRMCAGSGNIGTTAGGGPGPDFSTTWTAGYSQGTNVITLGSAASLFVGATIWLDQQDDASDGWPAAGDIWECSSAPACSSEGGNSWARVGRVHVEGHKVTAINGNQVTISPGVMSPDFRSAKAPGAWWGRSAVLLQNVGLENFSMDFSGSGGTGVEMVNVTNAWVKGLRLIYVGGPGSFVNHLFIVNGLHVSTQDNYFYGPTVQGNTQYAYSPQLASLLLFQNNILHNNVAPTAPNDPEVGSVYGYNYVDHAIYATSGFQQHNSGDLLNLFEGNDMGTISSDNIHGTHFFLTYFRNYFNGHQNNSGGVAYDGGIVLLARNRFHNIVGNVLGASTYTTYQINEAGSGNGVYSFGWKESATSDDTNVRRTVFRWGNWDNATSTNDTGTNDSTGTHFMSSEVPSGIANFPNSTPSSQALPASFYLNAKPSWFGNVPWPPIGPDVSNGNAPNTSSFPTGGHANKIPARQCFESLADDPAYGGTLKKFNSANCYAGGDPPPDPPGGLQAVPH